VGWRLRRIVTGRDVAGRSRVLSDGAPESRTSREGHSGSLLWSLPAGPLHPESGGECQRGGDDLEPPPGACSWRLVRLSPGQVLPAQPGMRRTDTLDWITVLGGALELILDEDRVRLGPGDCVVQRGTRHAWRVPGPGPCSFAVLMLRPAIATTAQPVGPRQNTAPQGIGPRRVVTQVGVDGLSRVECDGEPPNALRLVHGGGAAYSDIWQTFGPLGSSMAGGDTPPGPFEFYALGGGACWKQMWIPPDADLARIDASALAAEYAARAPGIAAGGEHDPGRPGRHRTDSIDLLQVLSGSITLVLDEGEADLRAGEFAVQQGTWHAWSNRSAGPCLMQAMMISTGPLLAR